LQDDVDELKSALRAELIERAKGIIMTRGISAEARRPSVAAPEPGSSDPMAKLAESIIQSDGVEALNQTGAPESDHCAAIPSRLTGE
jgi:AmiR/NasT family two-component response regulator